MPEELFPQWQEREVPGTYTKCYTLRLKEGTIDIVARNSYCDRGKWDVYFLDKGFPVNENPVDAADRFPRIFFSLERAKLEMQDWVKKRKYTLL